MQPLFKIKTFTLLIPILCFFFYISSITAIAAPCTSHQGKIKIILKTDSYGHETFWQIKNAQTNQVILSGGNPKAFPGGQRGTAATDPGAYPGNTLIKDSICIDHGNIIKFVIYDAYGDGICCNYGTGFYYLLIDNDTVINNKHFTVNDSTIFSVPLPTLDITVEKLILGDRITVGNHFIDGIIKNKGTTPITSFMLNWNVNGGAVRSEAFENIMIAPHNTFHFTHKYGWKINNPGSYELSIWISAVNGNTNDEFTINDTLRRIFTAFQNHRTVLVEVWTNASCAPCARYVPPLEELLDHSNNHVVSIMYHSNFPGFDIMNSHNPQHAAGRGSYYNVNSYPSWFVDGADLGSDIITAQRLYDRSLVPADFDFLDAQVWIEHDTLYAKSKFQAKSNFTGNFRAHAVVIERDMDFTNGPNPGSNGEKTFDWVMKYMLTGVGGKNIGSAFVIGMTDSVSGQWAISNVMDTSKLAVIFFIQNNTGKEVRATHMVALRPQPDFTEPPQNTGLPTEQASPTLRLFPNPTDNVSFIQYDAFTEQPIEIHITNLLGQTITRLHTSQLSQGEYVPLHVASYPKGIYVVSIHTNKGIFSGRLVLK